MNALSWLFLCLPLLTVAWMQSRRGTQLVSLHVTVVVLALAGSLIEFVALVLHLGAVNAMEWLADDFNLQNWGVFDDNQADDIGWRVLEVVNIVTSGSRLWIDALEWLFLFGIFTLLFVSIWYDPKFLSMRIAWLGFVIGLLSLSDFATDILCFQNWRLYAPIGMLLSAINRLLLFPVWFIWLGRRLYQAKGAFKMDEVRRGGPTVQERATLTTATTDDGQGASFA